MVLVIGLKFNITLQEIHKAIVNYVKTICFVQNNIK